MLHGARMKKSSQPAHSQRSHLHRRRWRYLGGGIIILLIIGLIAARLYLPVWLTDYVNKTLNTIPGYRGGVESIHVQLIRGAYTINGLSLKKLDAGVPVPFVAIETADLSLQWGALFKGRIVSDVHLYGPTLNFAKGKSGGEQTGRETNWNDPIKKLMPIDINVVEIQRGTVTYKDFSSSPPVDISISNLSGTLNELRNTNDANVALPSSMNFTGDSIGNGKLAVKGKLNVLTPEVDMDLDGRLEHAELKAFNSFSNAYGGIDFKAGSMDIYTEMVIKSGQIDGYVKPIVQNLSVDKIPEETNPFQVAWATVASFLLEVFSNQSNDQFATRVPLSGSLDKVETEFWPTLGGIFRNAFIEAFRKGTDGDIRYNGKSDEKPADDTSFINEGLADPDALNPAERRFGK